MEVLETGIDINGVYHQVIPVSCNIDIPKQIIINQLEAGDNKHRISKPAISR